MNMTRLEAVNRILRAAGEKPVSSLSDSQINDTQVAEALLDEVNRREQWDGFHFNTVEVEFIPDENDNFRIVLPEPTLQVSGVGEWVDRNFTTRIDAGDLVLYDVAEATTSFEQDASVTLRVVSLVEFEEIPLPYQFSVVDQAAVEYQMTAHGSESINKVLEMRAARSRAVARQYDMRERPKNIFKDGRSAGPRMGRDVPRGWNR